MRAQGVKKQKLYLATLILSYKAVLKYCPYAIVDGLFRVDVMQKADENYVVKEFESFEAAYYSRDDVDKLKYLYSKHLNMQ